MISPPRFRGELNTVERAMNKPNNHRAVATRHGLDQILNARSNGRLHLDPP